MQQGNHQPKQASAAQAGEERFRCGTYACSMAVSVCLLRQCQRKQVRNGASAWRVIPPHLRWCASGRCEQGNELAKAAGVKR